jgi:hypothetical protein
MHGVAEDVGIKIHHIQFLFGYVSDFRIMASSEGRRNPIPSSTRWSISCKFALVESAVHH